jgi:hypothetical protein
MGFKIITAITFEGGPSWYILIQTVLIFIVPRNHHAKQEM